MNTDSSVTWPYKQLMTCIFSKDAYLKHLSPLQCMKLLETAKLARYARGDRIVDKYKERGSRLLVCVTGKLGEGDTILVSEG